MAKHQAKPLKPRDIQALEYLDRRRRRPVIVRALRQGALLATNNLTRGLLCRGRFIMAETIDDNHLAPREGSGYQQHSSSSSS
jgi:hypothetical protein